MWVGQEPLDVKVVDISIPTNHAARFLEMLAGT
jgi:hypothetical protein